MNRKFDDIEMLEIPDDEESNNDFSISSETEGISDSQDSSKSEQHQTSPLSLFKSDRKRIELSEWLDSDETLNFELDSKVYKKSIDITNSFDQKYIQYINSLYKIIEKVTSNDTINLLDVDDNKSPIGLITDGSNNNNKRRNGFERIDDAFQQVVGDLQDLISSAPEESHSSNEFQSLQHSLYILECLEANVFYHDLKRKPELIIKWVNTFDPKPDSELLNEVMINTPKPYLHPQFWNTCLSQLIIRGLLPQVHDVIEHSQYQELEEKCPDLYSFITDFDTLLSNYTSFALKGQFTQWKLLACEFRDSLSAANYKSVTDPVYKIIITQIYDLACIITGLPKTISSYCDTWYEVYLALSLYQIRDNEEVYEDFYKTAISEKPPPVLLQQEIDDFDELSESSFINILEGNYVKVLEALHELDPPTTAYISELMELKQVLNSYYLDSTIDTATSFKDLLNRRTISEYFLTRHAYDCLNIHDLVPVGVGILLNSVISSSNNAGFNNRKVIANFLPNYHYKTNDDLEWALTICADLNLLSTARQLYYQAGLKSLDDGYIYEALNNFVNCYDPTFLTGENHSEGMQKVHYIIWDLIFADSLTNNRPVKDELINNIIDKKVEPNFKIHPVIQQCLSPYAVLKKFYASLANEETKFTDKISKLIHLLQFNFLPKRFVPLLLVQFLPFLMNSNVHFQLSDLIVIIDIIDNYETSRGEDDLKEGSELYLYSINNIEPDATKHDWRIVLGKDNLPKSVNLMIRTLRDEITAKVGKVFIK
ncbi:NUP85 Nucleoporin NUP85 [Candida maltosa Xu316]